MAHHRGHHAVTDKAGHAYDTITPAAMKKAGERQGNKSGLEVGHRKSVQGRKIDEK
jgi:hypothetical protein